MKTLKSADLNRESMSKPFYDIFKLNISKRVLRYQDAVFRIKNDELPAYILGADVVEGMGGPLCE